ncbi:MAG TPA: pseudouridine synthase [Bacteroidota bacterium]|nr:pseudouridine synthase [Bacteroidota bacterium]
MHSQKVRHYILFNKPYGVLSQFTSVANHPSLKDFGPFPRAVYPVGRLDAESEGLLLLTNDDVVKHQLTDPKFGHPRTYLVQVEGIPAAESLERLRLGVIIDKTKTRPTEVVLLDDEPTLPSRTVPIRSRRNIPTAWLEMTLREGRNRQVRKMTAAVGHPTLRLVRIRIGRLELKGLEPGTWRNLSELEESSLVSGTDLTRETGVNRKEPGV